MAKVTDAQAYETKIALLEDELEQAMTELQKFRLNAEAQQAIKMHPLGFLSVLHPHSSPVEILAILDESQRTLEEAMDRARGTQESRTVDQ